MIVVTPLSPKPLTNIKYKSKQDSKAFLFEVKKKKKKGQRGLRNCAIFSASPNESGFASFAPFSKLVQIYY